MAARFSFIAHPTSLLICKNRKTEGDFLAKFAGESLPAELVSKFFCVRDLFCPCGEVCGERSAKFRFLLFPSFRKNIEISPQISPRATATNRENSTQGQGEDFPTQYLDSKRQGTIWAAQFRNQHFESFYIMQCISEGSSLLGHTFLWLHCGSTI